MHAGRPTSPSGRWRASPRGRRSPRRRGPCPCWPTAARSPRRADAADAHFEAAIASVDRAGPLDRARIHLHYGEYLRRERRRIDARVHLRAAFDGFEWLGAAPWAERALRELRATGEKTAIPPPLSRSYCWWRGGIRVREAGRRLEPLVGHQRDDLLDDLGVTRGASRSWVDRHGLGDRAEHVAAGVERLVDEAAHVRRPARPRVVEPQCGAVVDGQVRPCQTSRLGLAQDRSTLLV